MKRDDVEMKEVQVRESNDFHLSSTFDVNVSSIMNGNDMR